MNEYSPLFSRIKHRAFPTIRPVLTAALLLLALAAALHIAGPPVLERIIIGKMRSAGLENPAASVTAISRKGLHVSRVSAQYPALSIDSVTVTYSLRGLLRGSVDDVFVSGLKYRIGLNNDRPDPLLASSGNRGPAPGSDLPFHAIEIRSSQLVIDYAGKSFPVSFRAAITRQNSNVMEYFARPVLLGLPVDIKGRTDMDTLETDIHARASISSFLEPDPAFPGRTGPSGAEENSGKARIDFRWFIDPYGSGRGSVEFVAVAENLQGGFGGRRGSLEKTSLQARASVDDRLQIESLEGDFRVSGLCIGDFCAEKIAFKLSDNASRFDFSAAVGQPVKGYMEVSGKQPSVNQLLKDGVSFETVFDWRMRADVDSGFRGTAGPVNMAVDGPVSLAARGTGKTAYLPDGARGRDRWQALIDIQKAGLALESVSVPGYFLEISGLAYSGSGTLRSGPGGFEAEIRDNSLLLAEEAAYEPPGVAYRVKGLALEHEAAFSRTEEGACRLSASGKTEKPVTADANGIIVSDGLLSFEADRVHDPGKKAKTLVRARSDIRRVHVPAADTLVKDVILDIPVSFGGISAEKGSFSTGAIVRAGVRLPGISGRTAINDNLVQVRGTWPFPPGAVSDFSCAITAAPGTGVSGNITAQTGWFDLPEKQLLDRLVPGLEMAAVTGSVNALVNLDIRNSVILPDLRVRFNNIDAARPDMGLEISGIRGDIRLNRFFPLTTPGNQRIDVSGIRIGDIELAGGFAAFRLDSADEVFVEKTRWRLPGGGTIAAHAGRFSMADTSADIDLFFEDIDILKLAAKMSEGKIDGSGRVYGRIPVLYRQGRITIGNGYLYSAPGTGRLGIKDEAWLDTLLLYVRDAMQGHPYLSTLSNRLEQALQDFEYHFLAVDFEESNGDTSARIELRGRGVEGDPPQEVGSLVVNINDFGEIINRVLRFQVTREESIEKAFDALFDE